MYFRIVGRERDCPHVSIYSPVERAFCDLPDAQAGTKEKSTKKNRVTKPITAQTAGYLCKSFNEGITHASNLARVPSTKLERSL